MRLRSVVGAGVVLAAVVVAVVLLRTPQTTQAPQPTGLADSQPAPPPIVDARAKELTTAFRTTTLLPATVRFASDPHTPPGFEFRRFTDVEVGHNLARYIAEGSLVRSSDNAVLDHVLINVWRSDGRSFKAEDLARCDPDAQFGGDSCTQRQLPNGVLAKVVRNAAFAQTVASDATTGSPPGMQSELQVAYPNGMLLTVTLYSMNEAGIPLDDAAMLKLATIPGISAPR
jgi:hypothetical protein